MYGAWVRALLRDWGRCRPICESWKPTCRVRGSAGLGPDGIDSLGTMYVGAVAALIVAGTTLGSTSRFQT